MKVQSKKDYYTVKCVNQAQTADVLNFIQGNDKRDWFHWIYVSKCEEGDDYNNSIPESLSHLPIISFEKWQSLPDFPKPEYDPKYVAFKIFSVSELEEVKPKKIIGYKLIKPEYWESVSIITGIVNLESDTEDQKKKYVIDWMKHDNFGFARKLREAGVLDIWFEPVYEKESITLKSGVKLSEDDIAEVKEILNNK